MGSEPLGKEDCVEVVPAYRSFSERWSFPKTMTQFGGEGNDEVVEVAATILKPLQETSVDYKSFSENWLIPRSMPQPVGEGGEGGEGVVEVDATIIQPLQNSSTVYRSALESWSGSMPQLDGEGDEEEAGDATIHDLDERASSSPWRWPRQWNTSSSTVILAMTRWLAC